MALPTTIADALEETALGPKVVSTNQGRVESHDIKDLLAALRHTTAQTAASRNHFGLRIVKMEPPGGGF